jgi:hypothetical protein
MPKNSITVRAVMAFSLLTGVTSGAETDTSATFQWGETQACESDEFGSQVAPDGVSLLAAFAEAGNETAWVRVLQRENKFVVETSTSGVRRRSIDPGLAKRISALLVDDLSRDVFAKTTDVIPIDGIWYLFSADGNTCARVPWIMRNPRVETWGRVFAALSTDSARREADAWFWLHQLEQTPATLPTSLATLTRDQDVTGAATSWKHAGTEPLAILNHRAHENFRGDVVVTGELANNTDIAREHADVVATFYDSNGTAMVTQDGLVEFSTLPAGARSPFTVRTTQANFASYNLRIDPGKAVPLGPATIRITRHAATQDEEDLIVRGAVSNRGQRAETSVEIHVNLYDKAGRLLENESDYLDEPLQAGGSAAFEVSVERPAGYHRYEVVVNPEYREQDQ